MKNNLMKRFYAKSNAYHLRRTCFEESIIVPPPFEVMEQYSNVNLADYVFFKGKKEN